MHSYQINVAVPDGEGWKGEQRFRFLFRTDWLDAVDAKQALAELRSRFPDCKVECRRRNNVWISVELEEIQ